MAWQFPEAETSLDEVFTRAIEEGPQVIWRNHQEAMLMSRTDYLRLIGEKSDFIQHVPSFPKGDYLDLTRDRSPMCELDWGE